MIKSRGVYNIDMDGVTILNSYTSGSGFNIFNIILLFLLGVILPIVIIDYYTTRKFDFFIIDFLLVIVFILCYMAGNPKNSSYDVYQVTIDETVSFKEFNEKYKIISQKGRIYTIKERE